MAELARTKPNRPWLLKMLLFFLVLFALGVWGFYDATVAYPARGWADASYRLRDYLQSADDNGRLNVRDLSVDDPAVALADLDTKGRTGQLSDLERARHDWLRALAVLGSLDTETVNEQITADPRARLAELDTEWNGRNQPSPLAAYDIPVQWGIALVGLLGALAMLVHVLRIVRVRYAWDASERRLVLPDGSSLVPANLEDVDKRQWHKFIVYLKVKKDHERHGGDELRLDLYQHAGLEGWVLEMEKAAFPERVEVEAVPEAVEAAKDESE